MQRLPFDCVCEKIKKKGDRKIEKQKNRKKKKGVGEGKTERN